MESVMFLHRLFSVAILSTAALNLVGCAASTEPASSDDSTELRSRTRPLSLESALIFMLGPDVLSIDPGLGWLYVAAESGDLTVFDIQTAGVVLLGHDQPGSHSHSVAADPATHRVFFPLQAGPKEVPRCSAS